MFAFGLRYLMGWAMAASDGQEKQRVEWPPHPDRIFMALAAAWFETGEDAAEGAALRWLESLPPPELAASNAQVRGSGRRSMPVTSYVPVNDARVGTKIPATEELKKLKEAGLDVLPDFRSRQPRSFPTAIPDTPEVFLIWPEADGPEHIDALAELAAAVTHVGHSASLVQMWVEPAPPAPSWQPNDSALADLRMRAPYTGRLDELRNAMNRDAVVAWRDLQAAINRAKKDNKTLTDKVEKKTASAKLKTMELEFVARGAEPTTSRPRDARWQAYRRAGPSQDKSVPTSMFDPRLLVITLHGRRYPLASTLRLTEALRGTVLKHCPAPIPEWLSGHQPDTPQASRNAHAALAPLPFVDSEHADGRIMGLALVLPRGLEPDETARCLNPLFWDTQTGAPRTLRLFDGQWLEVDAELELRGTRPRNLLYSTWTRKSRCWASVTPVVLDRHFKGETKWDDAAESLKLACERIGLPRPATVLLNPVSCVEGVPHARQFVALKRKRDGGSMEHTHATLLFEEPVAGPVLLGAGRFRGYGLCRPMDRESGHA